jgi:hypothetical protein
VKDYLAGLSVFDQGCSNVKFEVEQFVQFRKVGL